MRPVGRAIFTAWLLAGGGCQQGGIRVNSPDGPPTTSVEVADATAAPDLGNGFDPGALADAAAQGADAVAPAGACPTGGAPQPKPCASVGVMVDPVFAGQYTCFDLGPVPGAPATKYGGLTLTAGRCSTRLLIGGDANQPFGKLYGIDVVRDAAGHIGGFVGTAAVAADAPYNDGGVTLGPGGVLFLTRWPNNELQQTRPGSMAADKVIMLEPLMVAYASASLAFVPAGLPGAGALKLVAWSQGQFYTLGMKPDAQGTYDITSATSTLMLPGGPEGFVYVAAGSAQFPTHSMLVSEWTAGQIAAYEIDEHGDPKLATRRPFIAGLQGAEGAYRDPATGDFFFSTWGEMVDHVVVVRGFRPIIE